MAETDFGVVYDGPALEAGTMPVRDLAPALLALGELFADASLVLYPDQKPVALNIKATREGSFWVQLLLESEHAWDALIDVFGSTGASALVNLRDLVIGGGVGVFWLVRRLRGRRVRAQEKADKPGYIRLTLDDDTTIEIPAEVWSLYQNVEIRRKARQVVAPLTRDGVESVKFTKGDKPEIVIEKVDLPAYELPEGEDQTLNEQERETFVEIVAPSFAEGNKWRLSDGQTTFFAAIEDERFLEGVESGMESFRKGDMLRCRMQMVQNKSATGGLQTEYRVLEVIEHIPRQTQMSIDDVD